MEEVDAATQAEMAVKLSENVRNLVRHHLREALQDSSFTVSVTNPYPLKALVLANAYDPLLVNAVTTVMKNQMNKS